MSYSPIVRELRPSAKPMGRPVKAAESQSARLIAARLVATRLVAAMTNANVLAVVAFCLIGLLISLNLMLGFPDFGAVIEQYNQF